MGAILQAGCTVRGPASWSAAAASTSTDTATPGTAARNDKAKMENIDDKETKELTEDAA